MKFVKLAAMFATLTTVSASFAADWPACPTMAQLGVSALNSDNALLPPWIPAEPSAVCPNIGSGENCYATFNLSKQAAAQNWSFIVHTTSDSPTDAVAKINQSGVFQIQGVNKPDTDEQWCEASIGGVTIDYFSPPKSGVNASKALTVISTVR